MNAHQLIAAFGDTIARRIARRKVPHRDPGAEIR